MKNLMKMETKVFNSLKRDLITWDEASIVSMDISIAWLIWDV